MIMATEPPLKRQRLNYADPEPDSDNDQDGDELVFEPEEVDERRDPDYRLARKRVKAGNRFQQAMSSIFAKYARDFTDVGDEVDLETGEVVVDNGHLQNMRFEGDVGIDEDEEEGILLEDLVDDSEDEGVRLGDPRDDWEDDDLETEDEERIMRGQEAPPPPTAFRPNPLAKLIGASGPLPQRTRPWNFPRDAQLVELSSFPRQQPRRRSASGALTGARYSGGDSVWTPDPEYKDDWTPIPKTRVGTVGSLRKALPSSRLLMPAPNDGRVGNRLLKSSSIMAEPGNSRFNAPLDNDDDLLQTYLAAKPLSSSDQLTPAPGKVMAFGTLRGLPRVPDEDSMPKPSSRSKSTKPKPRSARKAPVKKRSSQPTQCNQLVVRRPAIPSFPPPNPNCRRSSRARTQTDFLGVVSWIDVLRRNRSKRLSRSQPEILNEDQPEEPLVELSSSDQRNDYESVDDSMDEHGLPTPPTSAASGHRTDDTEATIGRDMIPDSQETRESRKSSPLAETSRQHALDQEHSDVDLVHYINRGPSYVFSDDEAPIAFTKRPPGPKNTVATAEITSGSLSKDREQQSKKDRLSESIAQSEPDDTEDPSVTSMLNLDQQSSDEGRPKGRRRLRNVQRIASATEESSQDSAATPKVAASSPLTKTGQPRRRRPRKSLMTPDDDYRQPQQYETATHKALATAAQETRSRRQLRPRKSLESSIAKQQATREIADSQEDAVEPEEHAPASSNKAQKQPRKSRRRRSKSQETTIDASQPPPDAVPTDETAHVEEDQADASAVDRTLPQELPDAEAMDIDTEPPPSPAPEPPQVPLSSDRTIADSASEPASSALQARLEATQITKQASPSSPQKTASPKPTTPRHSALRTSKAPNSRRSILSLLSDKEDNEEDGESTSDELLRSDDLPRLFNSPSAARPANGLGSTKKRTWKATPLTTEIYRSPVKRKRRRDDQTPGDTVKTPGGTIRTCGVDGFRCERDFCFNCL